MTATMGLLKLALDAAELAMTTGGQELHEQNVLDDVDLAFRILYGAVHGKRLEQISRREHGGHSHQEGVIQ